MEEELTIISSEIERLENRGQGEETLHLIRKGLDLIYKQVVSGIAFDGISMGIFYFNEVMKKTDMDRWKFFIGYVQRKVCNDTELRGNFLRR